SGASKCAYQVRACQPTRAGRQPVAIKRVAVEKFPCWFVLKVPYVMPPHAHRTTGANVWLAELIRRTLLMEPPSGARHRCRWPGCWRQPTNLWLAIDVVRLLR